MMHADFAICDSDMHVFEPADLWQRYIDPAYRHVAPVGLTEMVRDMRVKVKSRVILRSPMAKPLPKAPRRDSGWREEHEDAYAESAAAGWNARSQVEAMDKEGLDLAVLFPSRGLFVLGLDSQEMMGNDGLEPGFAAAIAQAYNGWLHDFCCEAPERMYGAAMVAPHNVEASVEETRRCVEEYGFKAIFLQPGCVNRRPWHHPAYDPLWAECARLDIPVAFHGGGQTYLRPDFSLEVFDDCMMWHVFTHPLGIMTAALSMTAGGVLQRFPTLRVALLEGNCSWAPWFFHRVDEHWEWLGWAEAPDLEKAPSEYFKSNCFVSIEADEVTAGPYLERFGDHNLLFSTDYPHGDSKYPHSMEAFWKLPIPDEAKRKAVGENWERLYKIPLAKKTGTS